MSKNGDSIIVMRMGTAVHIQIPRDNLVNRGELDRICDAIEAVIVKEDKPKIIIDLSTIQHVSSTFIGKVMVFNKKALEKGGSLTLAHPTPQVAEVFALTRLTRSVNVQGMPGQSTGKADDSRRKTMMIVGGALLVLVIVIAVVILMRR